MPEWVKSSLYIPEGNSEQSEISKKTTAPETKEESGWGAWVIRKISNNIALNVKNLHITLQNEGKLCTVHINEISMASCNHLWEESFVDPGKHNFMRKLGTFEGFQCSLNDCNEDGVETRTRNAVVQQIDFVARVAMIKDRLTPTLPENRIDILCLNPPTISLTVEQYNSIIAIMKLFMRKKSKHEPKPSLQQASKPVVPPVRSSPSVLQTPQAGNSPKPKGWFTWVVSTLTEEQDQMPTYVLRFQIHTC